MSDLFPQSTPAPACQEQAGRLARIIEPRSRDLGGFAVRRLLPAASQKAVGPFVFFDHLGPVTFPPDSGLDVRPHPHIGLATVTYLFEGEIMHRDSLGSVQAIRPLAINWMTAGRGIVHSERTPPEQRLHSHRLHALQLWVALPTATETCPPAFEHYPAATLPETMLGGCRIRVLVGAAFGVQSPVTTQSPALYADIELPAGGTLALPEGVDELALYPLSGQVSLGDQVLPAQHMGVLTAAAGARVVATTASRLVLIGGEPLGHRTVWWNLVASNSKLIEQAKTAWRERRFPPVPGDDDFIPLPD